MLETERHGPRLSLNYSVNSPIIIYVYVGLCTCFYTSKNTPKLGSSYTHINVSETLE